MAEVKTALANVQSRLDKISDTLSRAGPSGLVAENEVDNLRQILSEVDPSFNLATGNAKIVGSNLRLCRYRLELLDALRDKAWQNKRSLLSQNIQHSMLAKELYVALATEKHGAWFEDLPRLSFLSNLQGISDEEIDRGYRLRAFAIVYLATFLGEDVHKLCVPRLVSAMPALLRSATAFAQLEISENAPPDVLSELIRFPLSSAFPFSAGSSLERESFFAVNFLLSKASSARIPADVRTRLANVAYQMGSELVVEEQSHVRSLVLAAVLMGSDLSSVISVVRMLCHSRPDSWLQMCLGIILHHASPDRLERIALTTQEHGMLIENAEFARLPQFKLKHAILTGNLADWTGSALSKPSLRNMRLAVCNELTENDGKGQSKLFRMIYSGAKGSIVVDSSVDRNEILERVVKQPKLQVASQAESSLSGSASSGISLDASRQPLSSAASFANRLKMSSSQSKPSFAKQVQAISGIQTVHQVSRDASAMAPLPTGASAFKERLRKVKV